MEVGRLAGIRGSGSRIFLRDVYLEMGSGWDPQKGLYEDVSLAGTHGSGSRFLVPEMGLAGTTRKRLVGPEDFVDRVETRKARRKIFFCPAKGCWTGIWNIFRTSPKVRVGSCVDWGPALSSPSDDISIKPLYSQRGLYDEDGAKVSDEYGAKVPDGGGAKVSDLWSDKRGVA